MPFSSNTPSLQDEVMKLRQENRLKDEKIRDLEARSAQLSADFESLADTYESAFQSYKQLQFKSYMVGFLLFFFLGENKVRLICFFLSVTK